MPSEREEMPMLPLNPSHVSNFLKRLTGIGTQSAREILDGLLQAAMQLPSVDSANLLFNDTKHGTVRFAWLGLDGEFAEGDHLRLEELPWRSAIEHGQIWMEADAEQTPLSSLPQIDSPFLDRCLLPIQHDTTWHSLLILQSSTEHAFSAWERDLLQLMMQSASQSIFQNQDLRNLDRRLAHILQQSAQSPASLDGISEASHSALALTIPIATLLQHNFGILQRHVRKLQETLDYYTDEIRLNAPPEGVERVESFAQMNRLSNIRTDVESLIEDSIEGVFQLRYFLDHLRDFHSTSSMSEQLSFDDILDPILPILFSATAIQMNRPPLDGLSLYGEKSTLQRAFLMLFYVVNQHVDLYSPPPHVNVNAEQTHDQLIFSVQYPLSHHKNPPTEDTEEFLFLQRVMEEHQGQFTSNIDGHTHTMSLGFPQMFAEETIDDNRFSMEALELPALESSDEISTTVDPTKRLRLLFLGTHQPFLRSIRRTLSPSFSIHLASSHVGALDKVQAHQDFALVLCDLQEGLDETQLFLEAIQDTAPHMIQFIAFLVGERMSPQAEELAQRIHMRTTYRHASPKELETFIRKWVRLT